MRKTGRFEGHGEKYTSDHEEDKPYVPQAAHFLTAVSVSLPLTLYASVPDPSPTLSLLVLGLPTPG